MPWVYLLRCADDTLYTGAAMDLDRRMRDHATGRASRYTRSRLPVVLVWSKECADWGEALREEAAIKKLKRIEKAGLVASARPA